MDWLSVDKNSPADYAGIRPITRAPNAAVFPTTSFTLGDIITKVDGVPVNAWDYFLQAQAIDQQAQGDILELTVISKIFSFITQAPDNSVREAEAVGGGPAATETTSSGLEVKLRLRLWWPSHSLSHTHHSQSIIILLRPNRVIVTCARVYCSCIISYWYH